MALRPRRASERFMAQAERDDVASYVAVDDAGAIVGNLGVEVAPYGVAGLGIDGRRGVAPQDRLGVVDQGDLVGTRCGFAADGAADLARTTRRPSPSTSGSASSERACSCGALPARRAARCHWSSTCLHQPKLAAIPRIGPEVAADFEDFSELGGTSSAAHRRDGDGRGSDQPSDVEHVLPRPLDRWCAWPSCSATGSVAVAA